MGQSAPIRALVTYTQGIVQSCELGLVFVEFYVLEYLTMLCFLQPFFSVVITDNWSLMFRFVNADCLQTKFTTSRFGGFL